MKALAADRVPEPRHRGDLHSRREMVHVHRPWAMKSIRTRGVQPQSRRSVGESISPPSRMIARARAFCICSVTNQRLPTFSGRALIILQSRVHTTGLAREHISTVLYRDRYRTSRVVVGYECVTVGMSLPIMSSPASTLSRSQSRCLTLQLLLGVPISQQEPEFQIPIDRPLPQMFLSRNFAAFSSW